MNVGSLNDPDHRMGMAHFLEHMIFMGSEKYPDENSYSDHINGNGGYWNAYTEMEWTNFFLEINYSNLEKALDMMASNFEAPLMLSDAVDREIKSVESEYHMNYTDDNVRLL